MTSASDLIRPARNGSFGIVPQKESLRYSPFCPEKKCHIRLKTNMTPEMILHYFLRKEGSIGAFLCLLRENFYKERARKGRASLCAKAHREARFMPADAWPALAGFSPVIFPESAPDGA